MPKIKVLFEEISTDRHFLRVIEGPVIAAVSKAISVGPHHISPSEIDWHPVPLHDRAVFQAPVTFEIETAGYPDRKHHLRQRQDPEKDPLEILKKDIAAIDYFKKEPKTPFKIHIIFRDPENRSVKS